MKKTNWAILGLGKIAKKFATDLITLPNANLYAVGSRTNKKAKAFAKEFGATKSYGSYEALLADPKVDVVYIATPHVFHCENTLMALDKGIAVLCEKPLAINAKEVALMVAKAKVKNTFLMEALWTLFIPSIKKTKELVASGVIGEIQSVKADFGFKAVFDPKSRLFDPNLGGGSLLDIGIYPLFLAQAFLGKPQSIIASAVLGATNVDEELSVTLKYAGGKMAHAHSTIRSHTPIEAYIYGTKGYIHIPTRFHEPVPHISLVEYEGLKKTVYRMPQQAIGFKYEAAAVMAYLAVGKKESDVASLQFSIDLMETMDAVRKEIGLVYPMEVTKSK